MDRLRVPLRIWYADAEPIEVRVTPPLQIKAEHKFGMSLTDMNRAEHLYYLAWLGAVHNGHETRDFDAFLDAIVDIEPINNDEATASQP